MSKTKISESSESSESSKSSESFNVVESFEKIKDPETRIDNAFLIKKEALERKSLLHNDTFNYLYPSLDDPNFNVKIARKQEFFDSQYEGDILPVEEEAEKLCNMEMELAPYQIFVRNFLSFQTPYNSLLLYHGLGSGKTCSAIGVCEEMRDYLKQMGITKRILIVASPNVQENFKHSLFDERKLTKVDGQWNLKGCTSNKFLKEINPMSMKGLTSDKVINQIKKIINNSYLFLGYIEFANLISKKSEVDASIPEDKRETMSNTKLQNFFNDRLVVIDEIHNIRITDDNKNKRVALSLSKLVTVAKHLRLLLLSATPMYNTYKEIIWLINLMNINDNRATIQLKDVFDSEGNFKKNSKGEEIGKETLMRKSTGYISFVRGENPYTFPYRIFPSEFDSSRSIKSIKYPKFQLNNIEVEESLQYIDVYTNLIGDYQKTGYKYILKEVLSRDSKLDEEINPENIEKFGYSILQPPLEALNIVYPNENLSLTQIEELRIDESDREKSLPNKELIIGKRGLKNIMSYTEKSGNPPQRINFNYKPWVLEKYGKIFSPELIGNFSSKMKNISDIILKSQGIILIYSQYIDGGIVPMSLVLEELGFTKYNSDPLFQEPPMEQIDSITMESRSAYTGTQFMPAKYAMITGDKALSPNNVAIMKKLTDEDNKDGSKIKVILISRAGAEGLDFKNIRQVHIMDPWYNMNRNEQIIGRGVRNKSHCMLPFAKRNVEIYLHSTILDDDTESVDLYLYRLAEKKSLQIGKVARLLKENAVDCLLNIKQNNFTVENMQQSVNLELSSGKTILYQVGDKPFSSTCDYMEKCSFECKPSPDFDKKINLDTYGEKFIVMNIEKIIQRIKILFKENYFYKKKTLINSINAVKQYPLIQIYSALNKLVNEGTEYITDRYGRLGNLVNIDDYYFFQPLELNYKKISILERSRPLDYKREKINFELDKEVSETMLAKPKEDTQQKIELVKEVKLNEKMKKMLSKLRENYELATTKQIIVRGEEDWYKFCSVTIEKLSSFADISLLKQFVIDHMIEMLIFNDKLDLIKYLYMNDITDNFELKLKEYFDRFLLRAKSMTGILLENNNVQNLFILRGKEWMKGEPEDYKDMAAEIKKYVVVHDNINLVIGFISSFKNEYMIYKVKDMTLARHKGARCDQAGKSETIKSLNKIMGSEVYTKENTKKMVQIELCCLQEMTLRYYNYIKKDNKRWFFTPEETIINKLMEIKLN